MCLTCGHVACGDSLKNKCDRVELGESWISCYVDEVMPGG